MFQTVIQDIRFSLRTMMTRPAFTVLVVVTLALGIGVNSAVFTVINAVLLCPLGYDHPDRIVRIYGTYEPFAGQTTNVSPQDFVDWQERSGSFDSMSAFTSSSFSYVGADEPVILTGLGVTPDFFRVLGTAPLIGRTFGREEGKPSTPNLLVLSYGTWQRQFGGDANVIGREMKFEEITATIIGVMPVSFRSPVYGGTQPEFWMNLGIGPENSRGGHYLRAIGRLGGSTIEGGQAELDIINRQLALEYPATNTGRGVQLVPFSDSVVGEARPILLVAMASVSIALLIACANIANLLLARFGTREKEMAVRTALGAGRSRLVRQLLTESLMLATVGGGLALLVAGAAVQLILRYGPAELPRLDEVGMDPSVVAFTVALTALTGLLFGLFPAVHASKLAISESLKSSAPTVTTGKGVIGHSLVATQVALTVVLLIGASLLALSFWNLLHVDPGFETDGILTMRLSLPSTRYPQPQQVYRFYDMLRERLTALPGVELVAAVNRLPLGESASCDSFGLNDRPAPGPGEGPCAEERTISGDYIRLMKIPLIEGRTFSEGDTATSMPVVVINETMARRFWPDSSPIGKEFKWGSANAPGPWSTVVGVIGDVRHFGLTRDASPEVYRIHAQNPFPRSMFVTIRAAVEPAGLVPDVERIVWSVDPALPLQRVRTVKDLLSASLSLERYSTILPSILAALAMLLAVIGIYGVVSHTVTQRVREMGIRIALGASPDRIIFLVVRQEMVPVLLGLALGLVVAFPVTARLRSMLYGVTPTAPLGFIGTPLLLGFIALVACYIPARRATQVDPMSSLRQE